MDLTPAEMPRLTLSIDFHRDNENRLVKLAILVNKDSFSASLSLAPGSVASAKTIGKLADDIRSVGDQMAARLNSAAGGFGGSMQPGPDAWPTSGPMPMPATRDCETTVKQAGQDFSGLTRQLPRLRC